MTDYTDGTLVHTPMTGWIGEIRGGVLYALAYDDPGYLRVHASPVDIGDPDQNFLVWRKSAITRVIIIAPPDTPEWDQLNARLMAIILTEGACK